jgi:photosystem II stability/assembly factor-like uncharacterized protein
VYKRQVGNSGVILKTINGGLNWTEQNSNTTGVLYSVSFAPKGSLANGYAVGWNGKILKSVDGGENWISQASGTTKTLNSVHFVNPSTGYIVGDNGVILKTTNGGGVGLDDINAASPLSIFPNPFTQVLNVEYLNKGEAFMDVLSIDGKVVYSTRLGTLNNAIDMHSFENGMYIIRIRTKDDTYSTKIVKAE